MMKVLKTLMFKVLLSSLSFCLDTINKKFEQEFLISIPNNLRQLIIDFPQNSIGTYQRGALINTTTWERLCKTIQEQNKLKIFKINSFQTLSNNVLLSLEIQKHSLVHIEFKNIRFNNVDLKDFNNLYNLGYLKFECCKEILKVASFKLKELSIICNKWNAGDTSLMVKYFGTSLQRLLVEPLTINLIENISIKLCAYELNQLIIDPRSNQRKKILEISLIVF
uniref:Uncharacterized protein n=1 Tax=Rhizophagus irregularis (strain DAOM 181602 / DAOM 197198 / MUCL 43194) TaxID=747089 RepID=U9T5F1_RHIID